MTKDKAEHERRKACDSATAWFCLLEQARISGDRSLSKKANQKLKNLGVIVRFQKGVPQ